MLAQWQCPVASEVAMDMLHQVMCLALQQHIAMAIKMAHDGGSFVCHRRLFCLTNRSEIT